MFMRRNWIKNDWDLPDDVMNGIKHFMSHLVFNFDSSWSHPAPGHSQLLMFQILTKHGETMIINEVSTLAPTSGKGQPKYQ